MYIIITSTFLNSFSFSLSAQNLFFTSLSYHRLLVPYPWTAFSDLDCFFGLIVLIGLFYFLIIHSFLVSDAVW